MLSRNVFPNTMFCRSESTQGGPKKLAPSLLLHQSNNDQLLNLFHCQHQEKICNNAITKASTRHTWGAPQVCRYTTL